MMLVGLLGWKRAKNGLHWPDHHNKKVRGYYFTVRCRLTGKTRTRYVGDGYTDEDTGRVVSDWDVW